GLSWFAVDNMLTIPLSLLERLTGSDFWAKLSTVLLGPTLNRLPDYILAPDHEMVAGPSGPITHTITVGGFGPQPLLAVTGGHAFLVIAVYTAIFLAVAIGLTWRREIMD
ncbi:MAG TPA: hypothetical protein VF739_17175, partial [Ktedonobacterales bacterium]